MSDSVSPSDARSSGLRTFLIADVRGYTTYTREHGDERAARLASEFAAAVRDVVGPYDGNLLELRGDEALVVFESPRQALRAAVALQRRFHEIALPRGVGIGLDAGESIAVEGGYRGGALNLAARLCSQAAAGEILASEPLVHLAARMDDITYVETRTFRLKGYAQPIRAVEIAANGAGRTNLARRVRRIRAWTGLHRRMVAGGATAAIVVIGAAVLLLLQRGPTPAPGPTRTLADVESGIALVDARTHAEKAHIGLSTISQPVDATFAAGYFWVLNLEPLSFVQIDPKSGAIVRQVALPFNDPGGFAADEHNLWFADYSHPLIARIDVATGRELDRFDLSRAIKPADIGFSGLALGDGSLWATGKERAQVFRIDPETGKVQARIDDVGSFSAAFGDGALWTGSDFGVLRVNPATNTASETDVPTGHVGGSITIGGGFAWTTDESKGVVYKIDRAGKIAGTIATGAGAHGAFFSDGSVWVANQDVGTVSRIDAVTDTVAALAFSHPVSAVAAGDGTVLVALDRGRTYEDRIDALTGSVARLLTSGYGFESGEPALEWTPEAFLIGDATCAPLVRWAHDPNGAAHLEPEAAAALPTISPDGRTYTFRIRPGLAFSDASKEAVTAETYRYSIERALSPKLGDQPPGTFFVDDIAGEDAFRQGKAPHISGLVADGDRLSITLVAPRSDLVSRLALPFFCPVRVGTPAIPGGALSRVSGPDGTTETLDAAGPYYLADHLNGEYAILKRNPNYGGTRQVGFDAIALREGLSGGAAVERVDNGTWDGVIDIEDEIFGLHGELARQWGPGSDAGAAGDQRFFLVPDGGIWVLWLNASREPFSDLRLRRAIAMAVDRPAVADAAGSANVQLLPWNRFLGPTMFTGPPPRAAELQPRLAMARRQLHGVNRQLRLAVPAFCGECRNAAEELAADLGAVGLQIEIATVRESAGEADPYGDFDMTVGAIFPDTPDRAAFLSQLLAFADPPGWLPRELQDAERTLTRLTGDALEERVTRLEDQVRSATPGAVFGYSVKGAYFGPTVGCEQFWPTGLLDLTALCPGPAR
ncbi:MAG TPA: ABC transporter substrate-binding protein [Candidatus Limnocylindria bacterium]